MRNLRKLEEPLILSQNRDTWTREYVSDPTNRTKRYRYRSREIKAVLLQETAAKCIYCESKVGHTSPGDVEHKTPSTRAPEMHFVWSNLSIACTECNRRKNDYLSEEVGFLDPYVDDVEAVLVHLGPIVSWIPGDPRAENTVRVLELHDYSRLELLFRKIEKIEEVNNLIERRGSTEDHLLKRLLTQRLEEMKSPKSEFSAMVQSICGHLETFDARSA